MINEKKLIATAAVLSVVWTVTAETVPLWDIGVRLICEAGGND